MKTFIPKSALFVALSAFVISAVQGQKLSKTFSGIKKISLSTASGSCKLIKGTTNEVQVNVSYTYSSSDYQPVMEQDGGTLELKEDFAQRGSYSGSSSWELTIPDNMEIRFNSGSGNLEATNMAVRFRGNTGSGDYVWKSVTGESDINTGSGDITIENFRGDIDLSTGSGNVAIAKSE